MSTHLAAYLAAITLLTMTPGVDTMLVIRNSARGGWRDGAASSLGICCGLFVHATVSAVGISVILLQSAWAFQALKLAGAAYLVWLGATSLRNAAVGGRPLAPVDDPVADAGDFRAHRSLAEGFLCNVLNPKAVVFYMAFLPQFIDPAGSALRQSLVLAGLHFIIAMIWQCLIASAVHRARRWIEKPRFRRTLDGAAGAILFFFGIRLALYR